MLYEDGLWTIESGGEMRRLGTIPAIDRSKPMTSGFKGVSSIAQTLSVAEARALIDDGVGDWADEFDFIYNQGSVGSCFRPGTLIRMADGSQKPIEDVKCLDYVLTAEGNQKRVLRTMVREHSGNINKLNVCGHRHLRATEEHPILTSNGYVKISALNKGDLVAIPRYAPANVDVINPYDYISYPIHSKNRKLKQIGSSTTNSSSLPGRKITSMTRSPLPESISLTYSFGRLIGLYLAEGAFSTAKLVFTFNINERETLANEVAEIFSKEFGVTANIREKPTNNTCYVSVYGKHWQELFATLCGNRSVGKRLHNSLASGNIEFLEGVLEGWQDGDGLGDPERYGGVTVSHSLAMNMYDIATAIGYMPTIETLDVKINPKHNIKTRQKRYIIAWPTSGNSKGKQDKTHVWRKVESVEAEAYTGPVYNIEVEDDHSYVAEGVGVHNCNGWAGATTLEKARMLNGQPRVQLSGTSLYAQINGGVDRGSMLNDGMRAIVSKGCLPYDLALPEQWHMSMIKQSSWEEAVRFRAHEPLVIDTELEMVTAILSLKAPLVVAVHVGSNFDRLDSNGVSPNSNGPGNHSVNVDSIRWSSSASRFEFRVANSWGTSWGDGGYCWIHWNGHLRSTRVYHEFYCITSAQEDTKDADNPPQGV